MPEKLHDEPAAPQTMSHHTFTVLELGDFFAAHALQGLLACEKRTVRGDDVAETAYNFVAAMLAERQRRKERSE